MISEEDFQDALQHFVQTSNTIQDGWFLDTIKNQTFARKKHVRTLQQQQQQQESCPKADPNASPSESEAGCLSGGGNEGIRTKTDQPRHYGSGIGLEEEDFWEDDQTCMPAITTTAPTSPTSVHYEYHVVYSGSYAVPVLYLNVLNACGQRLSLDDVWGLCPDTFQPYLHQNKWTTLTQQEHPLLGIPYLMLHPCHTADLMTQVNKGSQSEMNLKRNYLITWLSTVGPLVGLRLSEQYAKSLNVLQENN